MSEAVLVEKYGRPAVPLVYMGFASDAKAASLAGGVPHVRVVLENIACECSVPEQIEEGVSDCFDEVINALTRPLTTEEKSPKAMEIAESSRIVFEGHLEDVNRFFYKRGWTDGFPIIPPTEDTVAEMLKGTDLPPGYIVAKMAPRYGKATVEKIAVNAVMAGALPTYLPLIIAGVQALTDPRAKISGIGVSTGSWAPFWVINGPIRDELHVNSKTGALGPGNIANATIGRALALIIKNIGGARPGIEDMGTQGNPGKYTMVNAENEEESPWEPLHVEQGFNKEDSAITLFAPNCFWQMMPYGTDATGILRSVVYNIPPHGGPFCLLLTPSQARFLADWTKKEIASFIAHHTLFPLYRLRLYYGGGTDWARKSGGDKILLLNPEDNVPVFHNPDLIHIIVAGGAGNNMGLLLGSPGLPQPVTRKAELPGNWSELVKKYRDLEPVYLRY
ncbi:MAG: hypothetical protein JXA46_18080 [Dehalococcoidales bacterium]|nr:hypothetical protein [Dehalococcoidales bacterium]